MTPAASAEAKRHQFPLKNVKEVNTQWGCLTLRLNEKPGDVELEISEVYSGKSGVAGEGRVRAMSGNWAKQCSLAPANF